MPEKIKVGVIGNGGISAFHLSGYAKNPRAEICALCDINEMAMRKRAEEYGVTRLYTDFRELVAIPELDAVSICTWNSAHSPCAIAALEAGKHVLCEKPMAMNAREALAMQRAAEASGRLLMIGFVRRFGNDCVLLKDFVDAGYFGDIYYAKTTYLRRRGSPGGWFGDKSRAGGGPLIDLGVHVIDLARYLMGNPKPLSVYGATFHKLGDRKGLKGTASGYASISPQEEVFDVEDLATAMIRFEGGPVLSVEASFSLNIEKPLGNIELFGTKAGCRLDPEVTIYGETNGYMTNLSFPQSTALSFEGLFEQEIDHFVNCVADGIPCRSPAADGVTVMTILDSIYESARTGHEVVLAGG